MVRCCWIVIFNILLDCKLQSSAKLLIRARNIPFLLLSSLLGYNIDKCTISPSTTQQTIANAVEWSDRNRLAAETWRAVDELYYDRKFGGNDWYQLRQDVVKRNYGSDDEVYKALQTMLSKLGDKYTKYLSPAQYDALVSSATGELIGLGVELASSEKSSDKIVIIRTEDGSPAQEAGMQKGDVILNVDGTPTTGISPEETAALMRGKKDTKASVRILRNEKDTIDLTLIRKPIKVNGVESGTFRTKSNTWIGDNKVVDYVRIKSFSGTTSDEVTHALEVLHVRCVTTAPLSPSIPLDLTWDCRQKDNPADAIVIDLRNNGGGLLQGAVDTSNLFLNPGKIVVFVVSKEGNFQVQQTLPNGIHSNDPLLPDLETPLYVLINSNTASAAEVFAAGLQENGRVKVIGETSFGKGIIQTLQGLRQGGITVTIARYETPLHNNINKRGIKPDINLVCDDTLSTEECLSPKDR